MRDPASSSEPRAARLPGWLGPAAVALVPALSLLLLLSRRVWDVDVFWQLRLGELILAGHGPILAEPFAASHLGQPLPTLAWAGQGLYAALRLVGGWPLLRLVDALCWLGGFWVAAWGLCRGEGGRRAGTSLSGAALALLFGLVAALPQASLRPQSLAALCFGLLVALVHARLRPALRLPLAAALLVAWQNLHPSVAIAAIWLAALAATGWAQALRRRKGPLPWVPSVLAVLAALAVFATPEGTGILAVSATNAAISRALGVSEWLPLWAPVNGTVAVPVLVVALLTGWLVARTGRWKAVELVPALALLALTVASYRFVLFWGIALVPVVVRAVPPLAENRLPRLLAAGMLALVCLIGVVLPVRFAPEIPLGQIERLRAARVTGTIYAHFPWGGPLIDAGYPAWHVAYDGRYYRYTPAEWNAYAAAGRGELPLADIERTWRPAAFLLDPHWNEALIAALRAQPARWRELPGSGPARAFIPAR